MLRVEKKEALKKKGADVGGGVGRGWCVILKYKKKTVLRTRKTPFSCDTKHIWIFFLILMLYVGLCYFFIYIYK